MSFAAQRIVLPALLTAAMSATAGAQQMQCDVNESSPRQVTTAFFAINQAQQAQQGGRNADATRQLQAAVKALTENPEKINNPLGRSMVLGKALALWMNQPDVGFTPTRASIGWPGAAPDQRIDLVAAVDSLFGEVEKAQPGCKSATAPYRAQKPWLNLVNGAIEAFNAERLDSAATLASRANRLYAGSPFGFMVLGNVAQRRGQINEAIGYWRQSVEAAGADTAYGEAKRSILLAMANSAVEAADTATGAARQRLAAAATGAFEQIVKEFPQSSQAGPARAGLTRVRLVAGDTAGFRASYRDMMDNPGKYSYSDLLVSAVAAARANQYADAIKLFENVLALNPYNRDALFNITLMYNAQNQHDKMLPYLARLIEIDPSNADNFQMYALAYNGVAKAAQAKKNITANKAANDSTVKYYQRSQELPQNVTFTEWTNTQERSQLSGMIENRAPAAKTYTITIEFLDKSGAVVGAQTVTVPQVAPKATARFSAKIENNPSVIAYRYKVS